MIKKSENCLYCGEKMKSVTAKKRYCSPKCKVYHFRERGRVVAETSQKADKTNFESNSTILEKRGFKSAKIEKLPPSNLKGIDLAIWKAENN